MDRVVWASFLDEFVKISANVMMAGVKATKNIVSGMKPAAQSTGPKIKSTLKTNLKPTNYSVVHSTEPAAAYGAASASKSVPPPPVRT
jgi:hypothetical protein